MTGAVPLHQAEAIYHHRVGDSVLTSVNDGYLDFPFSILNGIDMAAAAAMLEAAFQPATHLCCTVNAFVLRRQGQTVLIDAGGGARCGPTAGWLRDRLAVTGIDPCAVNAILLTHIHSDHYGGLISADGSAVFPNAEIRVHEADIAFWLDETNNSRAPEAQRSTFSAAQAALAPYRRQLRGFRNGEEVLPGVAALHLPGHTPGHSGFRIGTGTGAVLVWGDIFHVPAIQAQRPDVSLIFDTDPARAIETRKRLLDQVATDRLRVAGMHLHFPGFAHVVRATPGYALVPAVWEPAL